MPVISFSLTRNLLQRFEQYRRTHGYTSKSEVLRKALIELLSDFESERFPEGGLIAATVTAVFNEERDHTTASSEILRLRHLYDKIITWHTHLHIQKRHCVELFVAEGLNREVTEFVSKIRAVKGIREVRYTFIPMDA